MITAIKERPILFSASDKWIKIAATRIGLSPQQYVDALNRGEKYCGGCMRSLERNKENFGTESKSRDRMKSRCRQCVSESKKSHYLSTRTQQRERQLKYQRENRDRLNAYNSMWSRNRNKKIREEMILAYGGRCACCGENEPLFLELDHIHNDGAEDRRKHGNQLQIILRLKADGWPKDRFQLLCSNCNQGKNRNGGICPHQMK